MSEPSEEVRPGPLLFTEGGQLRLTEKSVEQLRDEHERVQCLGMTFDNDGVRRAHFLEKLRAKLQDPAFRTIEGFPLGKDDDILALSDPPYYTACPNPFTAEFFLDCKAYSSGQDRYQRSPLTVDV